MCRQAVRIEVRLGGLKQLFNSMDPSPFKERDLDPQAEEFIVSRALGRAINDFLRYRAAITRRRLRDLFRVGRVSFAIGLLARTRSFGLVNLTEQRPQ